MAKNCKNCGEEVVGRPPRFKNNWWRISWGYDDYWLIDRPISDRGKTYGLPETDCYCSAKHLMRIDPDAEIKQEQREGVVMICVCGWRGGGFEQSTDTLYQGCAGRAGQAHGLGEQVC